MFRPFSRRRVNKRPSARIGSFAREAMQVETLEPRTMLTASSVGAEFQVNTFTTEEQSSPAVAMNGKGDSVVVWRSNFNDASFPNDSPGIYGQRYDSVGRAVGVNFLISTPSELEEEDLEDVAPAVEMDDAGNFVVAWTRATLNDDGVITSSDVFARRFNSAGNPLDEMEFQVNEGETTGIQGGQGNFLAMDSAGNFIVSWLDTFPENSQLLIQRFSSAGERLGNPIAIPPQSGQFSGSQVAMDDNGGFAVTWVRQNSDNTERDIHAQFFAPDGTAIAPPIDVSTEELSARSFDFDIAKDAAGNTTIVWLAPQAENTSTFRIVARQFDANGTPLGVEFLVNPVAPGIENGSLIDYDIRIAMNDGGEFAITWRRPNDTVAGRAFNAGPFGEAGVLRFNAVTSGIQKEHAIAMNDIGDFVVFWGSGTATSQNVFGRRVFDDTLSTIGGFDRATGQWYLRNQTFAGTPDFDAFSYGGPGWQPVVGDWNGDGQDTIGVVSPFGEWYLRNTNSSGAPDIPAFGFGRYDWIPMAGDWNGDGIDTVGSYNRLSGGWYLRNSNTPGNPNVVPFEFGGANLVPVSGDWDDTGTDTVGVYDITTGMWYLRNSNSAGTASITPFQFGAPGFTPVVGDWDGNGTDTVGVISPDGTWYVRNSNTSGLPDFTPFSFGNSSFALLSGDWDARSSALVASGTTKANTAAAPILDEQLQPIVNEAIARWVSIDVDATQVLSTVDVRLADLDPGVLGRTLGNTVWIDRDAAGRGWFVDSTPMDDEEFTSALAHGLLANDGGAADGRIDLLSVVAHELGHVLGLDHAHGGDGVADLMGAELSTGVRTVPVANAVDRLLEDD